MRLIVLLLASFIITSITEFVVVHAVAAYSRGKQRLRPDGLITLIGLVVLATSILRHLPDSVAISMVTLTSLMWGLAQVDIHTGYLPDPLVFTLFLWSLIHRLFVVPIPPIAMALGLIPAAILLGVHLWNPKGLGLGDVKLAAVLGLLLGGSDAFLGLLLGMILAAAWALVAVRRGRITWTKAFPYGPFLILGAWTMLILHVWL